MTTEPNDVTPSVAFEGMPTAADTIVQLFGKPSLLISEDPNAYHALLHKVVDVIQPCDIIECGLLREYVDLKWDIMRFRRAAAGIVNVSYKAAVETILNEFAKGGIEGQTAEQLADLFFTDVKVRVLALDHLRRFGVNEETISSQALATRSSELEKIANMRARDEIQALAVLRELDRYRQAVGRRATTLLNPLRDEKAIEATLVLAESRA